MLEFLYTDNISTTLSPLSPVLRELSEAADALEVNLVLPLFPPPSSLLNTHGAPFRYLV